MRRGRKGGRKIFAIIIGGIIVGILAVIGIPLYTGYVERAPVTEATSIMGAIITSQRVYFPRKAQYNTAENSVDPKASEPYGIDIPLFKGEREPARIEAGGPESFTELVKRINPSVINIRSTKLVKHPQRAFRAPFGPRSPVPDFSGNEFLERFFGDIPHRHIRQYSLGSGFIIDEQGYILTNNHVVEKAEEIKVLLSDDEEFGAEVVGRDPKTDIALIKIETTRPLQPVKMGDSEKLEVGERVIAIGNPCGIEHTVSAGIVSAKGRVIGSGPYDNFIETDASINPGNIGGPLINMNGEVIGINTAYVIAARPSIGFAIPINMAKEILPQLKEKGRVTRGWLGVGIQKVTSEIAESFGLKETKGALVSQVFKDSPAEKAGIQREDIIIEFDGKKIEDFGDLSRIVASTPVRKAVAIKVFRGGQVISLEATVGEMEEPKEVAEAPARKSLGITGQNITPEIAASLGLETTTGVVVSGVEPGSPAAKAGTRRGDVIIEVHRGGERQPIGSITAIEGEVWLAHNGDKELYQAMLDNCIYPYDHISTKQGRVQILFQDESVLNLAENTTIEITEFIYDPGEDKRSVTIQVMTGRVRVVLGRYFAGPGSKYVIRTPTEVIGVKKGHHIVDATSR